VISKGIDRTAEEIGRALSKTSILISSGSKQIEVVPSGRHVVISTPGSEPLGEFAGVFLLDGERIFNRPTLRSEELAGFLWWNLIGKASLNAEIFLSLPNNHPLIQSILRRDPSYLASHQLVERKNAKMPPYFRIASVEGDSIDISKFAENLRSSTNYEITGPMLLNKTVSRLIIRATLERGSELVDLLDDVVKIQSIKGKGIFKIRFDQFDI
jgi:primosomal protein N' (replication factor Y)